MSLRLAGASRGLLVPLPSITHPNARRARREILARSRVTIARSWGTLAAFAHSVLLKVTDGSPRLPVIVPGSPLHALDPTSRGIALVAQLSRDWGVTAHAAGGKTVWATFDS